MLASPFYSRQALLVLVLLLSCSTSDASSSTSSRTPSSFSAQNNHKEGYPSLLPFLTRNQKRQSAFFRNRHEATTSSLLSVRGGGSSSSSSTAPRKAPTTTPYLTTAAPKSSIDWEGLNNFVRSAAQRIWAMEWVQQAANTSPADVVRGVSSMMNSETKKGQRVVDPTKPMTTSAPPTSSEQQTPAPPQQSTTKATAAPIAATKAAIQSSSTTKPSALTRSFRLTVAALLAAEILEWVQQQPLDDDGNAQSLALAERLQLLLWTLRYQTLNFVTVGRGDNGLLRRATWQNATLASAAIQQQVHPKYQWVLGTTLGLTVSPWLWSSLVVSGGTAATVGVAVYAVAQVHHWIKVREYSKKPRGYFWTLKNFNNPIIYAMDDVLEDVRGMVGRFMNMLFRGGGTADKRGEQDFHLTDHDHDDGQEDETKEKVGFPPHIQKGLLFGLVAGLLVGEV